MPFVKGQSGNPNGRPHNPFGKLIRERTNDGQKIIDRVMKIFSYTKSEKVALQAAEFLRDTGWGKPIQTVNNTGESQLLLVRDTEWMRNGNGNGKDKTTALSG